MLLDWWSRYYLSHQSVEYKFILVYEIKISTIVERQSLVGVVFFEIFISEVIRKFRCYLLLIMRREGISLRSTGGDPGIAKPRLLETKAKRLNNNKITIYSQKNTSLMSTQSLPEDTDYILCTSSTLKSQSRGKLMDSLSQQLSSQKFAESGHEPRQLKFADERLVNLIKEEIDRTRSKYERHVRELLQANQTTISELRQILFEQQSKLAQKQQMIKLLLSDRYFPYKRSNSDPSNHVYIKSPKIGEYNYIKDRVEDIEVKLRLVLQTLSTDDEETACKIQKLEDKLIKYYGNRISHCKDYLLHTIETLTKKIESFEPQLTKKSNLQTYIGSMRKQVQEFKNQIDSFNNKQRTYQSPIISQLQSILSDLNEKMTGSSFQNSRKLDYFLQDDDQFFYPHSERIYQSNDEYEHFQSDSQEEKEKKENKPPNLKNHHSKHPN